MRSSMPSSVPDGLAVGRRDELHGVAGRPARGQLVGEDAVQGAVGVDRLLAAAEDDGVAALDAEGGGVGGDVGPALVDEQDHAERDADLRDVEPVGPAAGADDLADRVGQRGDLVQRRGDVLDALRG